MPFVLTFLLRRLAQGVVVVLLVAFLIFTLLRVIPGDPVRMMVGPSAPDKVVEQLAEEFGLRDPIPVQFGRYLLGLAQGDLGESFIRAKSGGSIAGGRDRGSPTKRGHHARVLDLIADALPLTIQLAALGIAFTLLIALPLGIAGGLYAERWPDRLAFMVGSFFVSLPNFWLGLVLILLISARAGWLPAIGYRGFAYTVLPAVVLAVELSRSSSVR